MMHEKEEALWGTIMRRCMLDEHPKALSPRNRALQFLLLTAMSTYKNQLPKNRKWSKWYDWSDKHHQ